MVWGCFLQTWLGQQRKRVTLSRVWPRAFSSCVLSSFTAAGTQKALSDYVLSG